MRTGWLASSCVAMALLAACAFTQSDSALVDPDEATGAEAVAGDGRTVLPVPRPADAQPVTVVRIVDGDTLRVTASLDESARGDSPPTSRPVPSGVETVVRLLEIDTPETRGRGAADECFGTESTRELSRLLPAGSTAWVRQDRELLDRYDRTLLYVWNAEGTFVNEAMIEGGFAEAVLFRPNDLHIERLRAAESRARADRAGLWGACAGATSAD